MAPAETCYMVFGQWSTILSVFVQYKSNLYESVAALLQSQNVAVWDPPGPWDFIFEPMKFWGLLINPVVPGRGTGPGSAKVAKMLGWARGGAGPALWHRAGVRAGVRKDRKNARLGLRGCRAGTPGPPGSVLVSPGLRACAN